MYIDENLMLLERTKNNDRLISEGIYKGNLRGTDIP